MKKSISVLLSACVLGLMTFQTSCIGSFNLTKSYWEWNSGLGKWPGAVFFFFLGGIITGVTLFVDVVVLNLIEFWSGSNPMSMNEGDMEQQLVMGQDGNEYQITATKNRFDIIQMSGENAGESQSLIYNPENRTWSHEKHCAVNTFLQISEDGSYANVYDIEGRKAIIPVTVEDRNSAHSLIRQQMESQTCMN